MLCTISDLCRNDPCFVSISTKPDHILIKINEIIGLYTMILFSLICITKVVWVQVLSSSWHYCLGCSLAHKVQQWANFVWTFVNWLLLLSGHCYLSAELELLITSTAQREEYCYKKLAMIYPYELNDNMNNLVSINMISLITHFIIPFNMFHCVLAMLRSGWVCTGDHEVVSLMVEGVMDNN